MYKWCLVKIPFSIYEGLGNVITRECVIEVFFMGEEHNNFLCEECDVHNEVVN